MPSARLRRAAEGRAKGGIAECPAGLVGEGELRIQAVAGPREQAGSCQRSQDLLCVFVSEDASEGGSWCAEEVTSDRRRCRHVVVTDVAQSRKLAVASFNAPHGRRLATSMEFSRDGVLRSLRRASGDSRSTPSTSCLYTTPIGTIARRSRAHCRPSMISARRRLFARTAPA